MVKDTIQFVFHASIVLVNSMLYIWQRCKKSSFLKPQMYMGSSTETAAFQVYEILKIHHEFHQFF